MRASDDAKKREREPAQVGPMHQSVVRHLRREVGLFDKIALAPRESVLDLG